MLTIKPIPDKPVERGSDKTAQQVPEDTEEGAEKRNQDHALAHVELVDGEEHHHEQNTGIHRQDGTMHHSDQGIE